MTKSKGINTPKKMWSPEEKAAFLLAYPDTPAAELAARFNVTVVQVYSAAKRWGVPKSAAFMAGPLSGRLDGVRGSETRFQKGQQPSGSPFHPGHKCGVATRFKKGAPPGNKQEIGALRINSMGDLDIKFGPGARDWLCMRRFVWEQAYGPIPPGMCIVAKNGDGDDTRLENLEMLTRSENIRRNLLNRYPKELRNVMALRGRLNTQIKKAQEAANV